MLRNLEEEATGTSTSRVSRESEAVVDRLTLATCVPHLESLLKTIEQFLSLRSLIMKRGMSE